MKVTEFCSNCSKCPVVTKYDDKVTIGEDENIVELTLNQFDDLKAAIKDDKI